MVFGDTNQWEKTESILIYKNGKKEESCNSRLVSLTSTVCKLCEIVIKNLMKKLFQKEGYANQQAVGFRKGRSCISKLHK